MTEVPSNPIGFSERLRLLMDGWGFDSTRPLGKAAGVSHGTIANWLNGKGRATPGDVEKVAAVFGWSANALYYGNPEPGIMTRVAELDAFRARALRLAAEISSGVGRPAAVKGRMSADEYTAAETTGAKRGAK